MSLYQSQEGEFLCGQMLCGGALLRWGRTESEQTAEIVADVLSTAKKRSYLTVSGYNFVVDLIARFEGGVKSFTSHLWPAIAASEDWSKKPLSLESLWLLLAVNRAFPKALRTDDFTQKNFGRERLLGEDLLPSISKAIADSTSPLHIMRNHPAFQMILEELKKAGLLQSFWENHIDPTIARASTYRAMIGFLLLEKILDLEAAEKKAECVSRLLSPGVVGTAIMFLGKLDTQAPENDATIYGTLAKFSSVAKDHPEAQIPLLRALLSTSKGGNISFDKVTGGNVVHQLVSFASAKAVHFLAGLYRDAVLGKSEGGQARTSQERIYAAHQLGKLVSHPAVQSDAEWKTEALNFLLAATTFNLGHKSVEPLDAAPAPWTKSAQLQVREVFFRSLDLKAKNFSTASKILKSVAEFANSKLVPHFEPLSGAMSPESRRAWKQMMKDVEAIDSGKKEDSVFQLLYLHMGFQLLSDPATAQETLSELRACHERSRKKKQRQKKGEREPHWVEVVVDVLLSLLSQNKNFLRQLVSSVASLLSEHMTTGALRAIMEAVNPPQNEGDAEDEDEEDGEWEDVDEDDNDENGKSDEEEDEDDDKDEEEDNEDEESSDDDEEEEGAAVSDEVKNRVKAAMGEHAAAESDEESIDMDDISEEDMKKMDEALANVFRVLSGGKKGGAQKKKEAKEALAMVHFKTRVLDLVDVYLSHSPKVSHILLVLEFALGALTAVGRRKEEQALVTRLVGTLKRVTNLRKPQQVNLDDEEFDRASLAKMLQSLVDLANEGSPLVAQLSKPLPIFSQIAVVLLKLEQQLKDDEVSRSMSEAFKKAVGDFFTNKKCTLPATFFKLPLETSWAGAWEVAEGIVSHAFNPKVPQFRRTQGISLVGALFHNRNLPESARKAALAKVVAGHIVSNLESYSRGGDGGEIKPRFICELLGTLHGLKISKTEGLDWEAVAAALEKFRANVPTGRNFQDVKKAFNKIGVLLKLKVVQGSAKKRPRNDSEGSVSGGAGGGQNKKAAFFADLSDGQPAAQKEESESGSPEKKKKKKKKRKQHNKEALEERKEQKKFAVEGQFSGMEMPSFSGLALNDNMNFTADEAKEKKPEDEATKKKEKKAKKSKGKRKADDVQVPDQGQEIIQSKKKKKKKSAQA